MKMNCLLNNYQAFRGYSSVSRYPGGGECVKNSKSEADIHYALSVTDQLSGNYNFENQ